MKGKAEGLQDRNGVTSRGRRRMKKKIWKRRVGRKRENYILVVMREKRW